MVDAFHTAVTTGVVGAGGDFAYAEEFEDGGRKLRGEVETIVGKKAHRASPEWNVLIDEYVGGSFGRVVGRGDGIHVGSPAKAVGEEEDISIAAWSSRERSKVVHADGHTWP